jgi:toxin CptA
MSSAASSIVADVALKPSVRALQIAFWLHVVPAALLPFAVQERLPALAILALILVSWMLVRRHAALGFGPKAIARVLARQDGTWWVERANGQGEDVQLLADSVATGWLLVLRFRRDDGTRLTRVILGDECDADALRRLRVRLGSWRDTSADKDGASS